MSIETTIHRVAKIETIQFTIPYSEKEGSFPVYRIHITQTDGTELEVTAFLEDDTIILPTQYL